MKIAVALHMLTAVIWVGGMFFAHMVLRPVAAAQLEPAQRLPLWAGCFERFFPWVWVAVVLLPVSGYTMLYLGWNGVGAAPTYIHLMNGLGMLMIALFLWVYFMPYRSLRLAVAAGDWPRGGAALVHMRRIVGTNLVLGLVTAAIASGGRYWG